MVHYDLSWNPTRHQQREAGSTASGRRAARSARSFYGENNPVDGAVLEVILRKARAIERQTGVRVPLPDQGGSLTKALMSAVPLRARAAPVHPRPRRHGDAGRQGHRDRLAERVGA